MADGISTSTPAGTLTVEEVAAMLGVSARTVCRLMVNAGLPAHKTGRIPVFSRAEVEAWIAGQRVDPRALLHLYPAGVEKLRGDR